MLIYSTILAVKDTLNHEAFIKLAIEWMQGSPHKDSIIPGVVWNGERNIRYGNNALWMEIVEYRNQNTIAIRYEKAEKDGIIWDTDFILNFTEKKLAVRLDRSYMPFFQSFDSTYSIPYFISLLMEKEYLELDGKLPVIREPIVIDKNNLSLLADIIFYRVPFNLPIVYISKTTYDEDPIPAGKLANRLRGIAHVLVQEANWTNPEIRNLCNSKNEYYGAVGIYYPLAPTNHIRYLYNDVYYGNNILFDKIINNIFTYSNSKSIPILYTWNGVNNSLLTDRLISKIKEKQAAERAQQQALNEKEQYIDAFDEDLEKLKRQIEVLSKQNEALTVENQGIRAKLNEIDKAPALLLGDEKDYYSGEIKEHILAVLHDSLSTIEQQTRRYDIIRDIINNNGFEGKCIEKAEELKRLLRGYKGMTSAIRQDMEAMGIVINEDGKHYKLTLSSDSRYTVTIAKTPSDHRAGLNCANIIAKKMF